MSEISYLQSIIFKSLSRFLGFKLSGGVHALGVAANIGVCNDGVNSGIETPDQPVIDFHGTKVTPGHVYACPEGEYRQLGAILMADGYVVAADGGIVRARTGEGALPSALVPPSACAEAVMLAA